MSNQVTKNGVGRCPYCQNHLFSDAEKVRNETISQCLGCAAYSMVRVTGTRYPLQDPSDKNSDPLLRAVR